MLRTAPIITAIIEIPGLPCAFMNELSPVANITNSVPVRYTER